MKWIEFIEETNTVLINAQQLINVVSLVNGIVCLVVKVGDDIRNIQVIEDYEATKKKLLSSDDVVTFKRPEKNDGNQRYFVDSMCSIIWLNKKE